MLVIWAPILGSHTYKPLCAGLCKACILIFHLLCLVIVSKMWATLSLNVGIIHFYGLILVEI